MATIGEHEDASIEVINNKILISANSTNIDTIELSSNILQINALTTFVTDKRGLQLPSGNDDSRPNTNNGDLFAGIIRFNNVINEFEGYNGVFWKTFGGSLIDSLQTTLIRAEKSPSSDNRSLDFLTNNIERMTIDRSGNLIFGNNISINNILVKFDTLDDNVTINGNLIVTGNTTTITSVNVDICDNIITLNKGNFITPIPNLTSGIEIFRGNFIDIINTNIFYIS